MPLAKDGGCLRASGAASALGTRGSGDLRGRNLRASASEETPSLPSNTPSRCIDGVRPIISGILTPASPRPRLCARAPDARTRSVILRSACPSSSRTVLRSTSAITNLLANVCRRSWNVNAELRGLHDRRPSLFDVDERRPVLPWEYHVRVRRLRRAPSAEHLEDFRIQRHIPRLSALRAFPAHRELRAREVDVSPVQAEDLPLALPPC